MPSPGATSQRVALTVLPTHFLGASVRSTSGNGRCQTIFSRKQGHRERAPHSSRPIEALGCLHANQFFARPEVQTTWIALPSCDVGDGQPVVP